MEASDKVRAVVGAHPKNVVDKAIVSLTVFVKHVVPNNKIGPSGLASATKNCVSWDILKRRNVVGGAKTGHLRKVRPIGVVTILVRLIEPIYGSADFE